MDQTEPTEVQILSKTKQRRSLGETKKREKSNRKPSRTAVVVPGDLAWPDVDDAISQEVLSTIERTMQCLKIPKRQCPLNEIKSVPKLQRSEFRRKWVAEHALQAGYDVSSYILKRSEIAIGVNCCSMNMETGQLAGLIIEKNVDPQIITKLLVPIAHTKRVPAISLSGLSAAFEKACGIKCIALGLKTMCTSPKSEFHTLLELVKEHGPLDANQVNQRAAALEERLLGGLARSQFLRQTSPSLPSSCANDTGNLVLLEGPVVATSNDTTSTTLPVQFSIEDEIAKYELKKDLEKAKRENQLPAEATFIPPKIRKTTPH
ncbi:ribonuclease P protein subunit p38 [Folsomia candida]|uniref:Ribonuclease P protein subunit p38 n=1 Tax=Folsomia candida TaxID=158441 RepID=A0A226EH09_FOLCA|nr:ribonuclease P protein subunit p38 [Folsomia candida]XP_021950625.1 ribonuclease P protein subunit p38 [Folsomia candida]XP_021950626.1 ribonuclease P protein subunit p38 [Folsomia candida]XP_021950627.1 ribonuclease P protein subunit p38 [Folsomia candida]OXA56910.1 Ribonuclease P protein subunit p38 [Folsomia candida]OXA56915.1 Ribonuclease P protein subunit p38 [Folsomia candida]